MFKTRGKNNSLKFINEHGEKLEVCFDPGKSLEDCSNFFKHLSIDDNRTDEIREKIKNEKGETS